ncbi:MAG: hypothetical protein QM747_12300 [Nocardioides sp.]
MNVDEQFRATLAAATEDVVGGPDLGRAVRAGRQRRRRHHAQVAGATLAVTGLVAGAAYQLGHARSHPQAPDGTQVATAPAYHDFVAGTQIDESLQATVAQHLPGLPAADDVYPSDWNTSGSIPDSAAANATEWHAVYQVSPDEKLTVVMSQPIPGQPASISCDQVEQADIACHRDVLADGSVESVSGYLLGSTTYRFMTVLVTPDGFVTETLDDVDAGSVSAARADRQLTDSDLSALVRDPDLTFPAPVDPPAPPAAQQ